MTEKDEELLADLLLRWEELYERGQDVPAAELCVDCPWLAEELARHIHALKVTAWLDKSGDDDLHSDAPFSVTGPGDDLTSSPMTSTAWESHPPENGQTQTLVGRYRLDKPIAEGGFARVWLAYDLELQRAVAVKVPKPSRLVSADSFMAEARRVARLKHPGIVPVHDVGRDGDFCFIVSEFVEAGSLADHLANSAASQQQAIRWVIEIADALEYAHLHGVVHRDIKPANILIDHHNRALLADFGIAQSANKAGKQALSLGTLRYMSPEQLKGREVDPRADIFSLGIVLHEALSGKLPYSTVEPNVLRREIAAGITDVSASGLPVELRRICRQALEHNPQRRHTSAAHLAADLRRYLDNKPRSSWWPWVLACLLLAVAGIYFRLWQHLQRAGQIAGGELGEGVKQVSKPPPKAADANRGGREKDEVESPVPPVAQSVAGVRQRVMDALSETRKMVGRIDAKAAIDVGHSYLREKKWALAIQEFRRAVRADPTNSDGWHGLGVALFNDGQYDEAVSTLSNAIKFDPGNLDARMHRGLAYNIQEDFDNAINDLADAIAKSPTDKRKYRETLAVIYSHRAAVRSDAQEFTAAAEDMDRAITLFPDGENYYHQRGSCLFNAGRFERAAADFAEAIRREPSKPDHYRHRGLCWQALGDDQKAAADFEKAKSLEDAQP